MQFYLKCIAFVQAIILSAAMVHIYHLNFQIKSNSNQREISIPKERSIHFVPQNEQANEILQNLSDVINENHGPDPSLFGPMKES